jgi:hypothetical protein
VSSSRTRKSAANKTAEKQDRVEDTTSDTFKVSEAAAAAEQQVEAGEPEPTEGEGRVTRDEALRQSYAQADKEVREAHLDEFNTRRQRIMRDLGHEWTPPLTERQRQEQEIREAIAKDPELAARLLAEQGITQPATEE